MRALILASLIALAVPVVAFAEAPSTFADLANIIVVILNNATSVLIVAGIAIYFYGISINILKFGEAGAEKIKAYFFWGIIILFVMVSIWGILRLLEDTLFGAAGTSSTGSYESSGGTGGGSPFGE